LYGLGAFFIGCAAIAQTAPAQPEVNESKLPEWVKRQARSPYKVIIESNAVRAKPTVPREDNGSRQAQRKSSATAAPPATVSAIRSETPATTTTAAAPVNEGAASAVERDIAIDTAAAPVPVPQATAVSAPDAAAVSATAPAPEPGTLLAMTPAPRLEALPLTLLRRVEPVLSPDLLDDRLNTASVIVAFTVNPDGDVVNLSVASTSDSRLSRSVLRAVKDWRYAPIETPRQHTVRFSFATQ
jgi:protein TonB